MAEKKIRWTEQQRRAIAARGSDVLVTASAGTGKTAVLSGRCVDIVSDKSVCPDVWSVLVLTFTEAAAEQMRWRIGEQLRDTYLERRDPHLREQLMLLQGADISTIHSFCKRLITEYFYKLGLDPTFRVIDSDEARLLKAEVLEKTIDWAWEQNNLTQGLQQLFYRRDLRTTEGFLAKIITLSDFLDGVVSREDWCERAGVLAETANPFAGTLGEKQKQVVAEKLQQILEQIQYAQQLYEKENVGGNWAAKWEESFVKPVSRCLKLLEAGDWGRCAEEILDFQKPSRFEYKPRGLDGRIAEVIRSAAKNAKDEFERLSELAILNPDYLDKVSGAVSGQTRVLVELVKKFDQLYGQAKRGVNCLDFADLEHYALRLLRAEDSAEDDLSPTETALALRQRYKYIFVDEYQDINCVQQAILDLLSAGGNVFVVGDAKQSIYAWRGAKPDIFLKHLKEASAEPAEATKGFRVDLNTNFRSGKGILDFVNKIFGRLMTASFGKISYDESAKLRPVGAEECTRTAEGDSKPVVELHILNEEDKVTRRQTEESVDEESSDAISNRQRQAVMIAQRIRQMVRAEGGKAEFEIYDKQRDEFRGVEYRDIVILMRSLAKKANDYVEVLRLAGVPVSCSAVAGYFEATEISDLLCLLKILDNPQRDIEMAAVLRSPLLKISDSELAKIKLHSKTDEEHRNFYDCVVAYCESGPDKKPCEKLRDAVEKIERWRTVARRGSLSDLIWQIYRETGYLSFVSALPNGEARRANLLKLHDRAIQFEGFVSSGGIASLRRFVEFIEKLQEVGQDWAPAEPDSSAENAVRIVSVHKSKGLEFPVVFLAELESRFNKRDIQDDCLADAGVTLGLRIIDQQSNSKLSSLAHQVIAEEKLSTALAEEMRILYVATTRARERLILTASEKKKHCEDIISKGFLFGERGVSDWELRRCQSPLEWLLYGLCDQKSLHEVFETGLAEKAVDDELFGVRVCEQRELEEVSHYVRKRKAEKSRGSKVSGRKSGAKRTEGKVLRQVKESLGWRYGFGSAPVVPAKLSVTEMTHGDDEYVRIDYSRALERKPGDLGGPVEKRLIGTATHIVIAGLDLSKGVNEEAINETKEKLLADGAITEAVSKHIDTESIMKFFSSELGRTVVEADNRVWREWRFTFAIPATEWQEAEGLEIVGCDEETIIVQGIIDMLVETAEGLLVIDFKTDDITAGEVQERAGLYHRQLELYGRAASAILRAKMVGKWLYFLTPGCELEVK